MVDIIFLLRRLALSVAALAFAWALALPVAHACETVSTPALKVLVVTPDKKGGPAPGIKKLLEGHGVKVVVLGWKKATAARARKFDIVVVAGVSEYRSRISDDIVLGYTVPILGVGPYGSKYFGRFSRSGMGKLKIGHPHM